MKHLDLFSGIGGFALAAEMVWPEVEHIFCDNDPFSQAILKKHWPNAQIYGDIRQLTADAAVDDAGRELRAVHDQNVEQERSEKQGEKAPGQFSSSNKGAVDILTGGFPCQPFSQAGRRKGTADDRHLWPEMLRVIREFNPRWVIGENVGGLVTWNGGMVLEQIHADLEAEGYEVQAFIVPAVALNAPHRRDRVWIVAHRQHEPTGNEERRRNDQGPSARTAGSDTDAPDSLGSELREQSRRSSGQGGQGATLSGEFDKDAADAKLSGLERRQCKAGTGQRGLGDRVQHAQVNPAWNENWLEVAARLCTLDDGLPNGLARPRGWRNAALKGAGNAIVPQVAAQIMKAIKEIDG